MTITRSGARILGVLRSLCVPLGLMAVAGLATQAAARDRIALGFSCNVDNGRVRIGPGADHTYPISGNRDQLPFTFCPPGDNGRCRTWLVHKFTVQCGGGRAMWNEIVAAAAGRVNGRASIENGQLLWQVSARPQVRYVALPRGYAPLSVIGARILVDDEVPAKTAPIPVRLPQSEVSLPVAPPPVPPVPVPIAPAPAIVTVAPIPTEPKSVASLPPQAVAVVEEAPPPIVSPPVEREAHVPEFPVAVQPASWRTFVETAGAAAAATREDGTILERNASFGALLIVATVLLLLSAIFVPRRKVGIADASFIAKTRVEPAGEGERAIVLRTRAEGQLVAITDALDRLAAVAPLRNALSRDLMASERRLAVVIAAISTSAVDADGWTRARRRLERINLDLDRLQMICEGAVTSLSGLRPAGAVPRTLDEAFAALGVAPGVGEPILKKLVEALRVSWHPDLARSDADREARTARMTEINVAWDLITGKRHGEDRAA